MRNSKYEEEYPTLYSYEKSAPSLVSVDEDHGHEHVVAFEQRSVTDIPVPRPDEPNLYNIPETLYPTYRPFSSWTKATIILLSIILAAIITWPRTMQLSFYLIMLETLGYLSNFSLTVENIQNVGTVIAWKEIWMFTLRAAVVMTISFLTWQELHLAPSRLSTSELMKKYFLPSKLSKYRPITLEDDQSDGTSIDKHNTTCLNVHWVEYRNSNNSPIQNSNQEYMKRKDLFQADAVYVNHGFGASSLSWLPILPRLTQLVGAKVGLGHDAVGFGFTDRPMESFNESVSTAHQKSTNSYLQYYTMESSAKIGTELLRSSISEQMEEWARNTNVTMSDNNDDNIRTYSIILCGHSMGSLTTLHMALKLNKEFQKLNNNIGRVRLRIRIILVAPALGFFTHCIRTCTQHLLYPILQRSIRFILSLLVGTPGFWRMGLSLFWGDKQRLSDSDVLRFQWPSVGEEWEQGLINFSKAQATTIYSTDEMNENVHSDTDDQALLREVLSLPEVERVDVILGTKDKIVPFGVVEKFFCHDFPNIQITKLDGQGHDPFEEDIDTFLSTVVNVLEPVVD